MVAIGMSCGKQLSPLLQMQVPISPQPINFKKEKMKEEANKKVISGIDDELVSVLADGGIKP
jgi:hypothetical protein